MAVKGEKIGQLQGIFWSVVSKQAYSYTVIQLYSAKSRTAWKIPPTPPKRFSGEVAGHPWNLFLFVSFLLSSFSSSSSLSLLLLLLFHPPSFSFSLDSFPVCFFIVSVSFSCYALPFPYLVSMPLFLSDNPTFCGF